MAPELQRAPSATQCSQPEPTTLSPLQMEPQEEKKSPFKWLGSLVQRVLQISSLPFYFRHPVFLPSLSLSLLYLTVLSFSGQMVAFLLSAGYNSLYVGIARTGSTAFELSATWIAPRLMSRIGPVRGGIWSLSWQMAWLAPTVIWFVADSYRAEANPIVSATVLVVGVAISRVGLWGFDLSAQYIVQDVSPGPLGVSMVSMSTNNRCRRLNPASEGLSRLSRLLSRTCLK